MEQKIVQFKKNYKLLKKENFIDENNKINRTKYKENLDFINKILNEIKIILFKKISDSKKMKEIMRIKDPKDAKIFGKKDAKIIVKVLGPDFKKFINKIDKRRKKQKAGADAIDLVSKMDKKTGKQLRDASKKISNLTTKLTNIPDSSKVTGTLSKLKNTLSNMKFKKVQNIKPTLFDIIFFPVWSYETSPYGNVLTIPLDLITTILDAIDPIVEFALSIINYGGDIISSAVGVVPLYGDAAAIGWGALSDPLEGILGDALDALSLFINILRKEWKLAIITAIDLIPNLSGWSDAWITTFYYLNKYLKSFRSIGLFKTKRRLFILINRIDTHPLDPQEWFKGLGPLKLFD